MISKDSPYHPRQILRKIRAIVTRRFGYLAKTEILAVTGSCGKTSATHFLGKILSDCGSCYVGVHRNGAKAIRKNMRKMRTPYRYLVQEAGIASPGDMKKIVSVLMPHVGIVTTIGLDHYTSFRTLEGTAAEKGLLIESLPKTGVAVLNVDDPHVLAMGQRTRAKVMTYGFSEQAEVRGSDVRAIWPEGLAMTVTYQGESIRLETALFGDLLATSLLAAVAGALAVGIPLAQCGVSLKGVKSFPSRLSIHQGPGGSWFLKDTVKAPYWSVPKVVALMKDVAAPRKTIVFGSFSDTGGADSRRYRAMARQALEVADRVVFVGDKSAYVRKMLTPELENRLFTIDSMESACRFLAESCVENEVVLLKSNSDIHLERTFCGLKDGFRCWKETCKRKIDCETCSESGLLVAGNLSDSQSEKR
ncbi:MAG: Mur ligase family protein [Syntrophotaleaceae bacterium]